MTMQKQMPESPKNSPIFFIIGRPRSGTSMLSRMFDAHPNVSIPFECPYILALHRKYGNISNWTKERLICFFNDLSSQRWQRKAWRIDRDRLKEDLMKCEGKNTYADICRVVHAQAISVFPKEEIKIIGDTTPNYSLRLTELFNMFPDALYIHLIRDYRDHLNSMLNIGFFDGVVPEILHRWNSSAKSMFLLTQKYPDRIFSIRYEDLVMNPLEKFNEMCHFLHIPEHPDALDFYKKGNEIREQVNSELFEQVHKSLFNPVDTSRIGRYKDTLSADTLKMAEMISGTYGKLYDYEPTINPREYPSRFKVYQRLTLIHFYNSILYMIRRLPLPLYRKCKSFLPSIGSIYYFFFPGDNTKKGTQVN